MRERSSCSSSLATLAFFTCILAILIGVHIAISHCGFGLYVPGINEIEHLFVNLLTIWISPFIKYLFKSFTHFLLNYLVSFIYRAFYIYIYSGYESFIKYVLQVSLVCGLFFTLSVAFHEQRFLIWSNLSLFFPL